MKWAYQVKYKIRTAIFLTGILLVILISNLLTKTGFSNLDESITSLVNDRLKPATYIYQLSTNVYQKRLLQDDNIPHTLAEVQALIAKRNDSINALVKDYEITYLTKDEQKEWLAFRTHLNEYNALERIWLQMQSENKPISPEMYQKIDNHFALTLQNLNALSKIQVGEAGALQKETKSIISNNLMMSYLVITLLIILGLFTLVLLTTTDHALLKQQQNQNWN